jgi:hypothetical protein
VNPFAVIEPVTFTFEIPTEAAADEVEVVNGIANPHRPTTVKTLSPSLCRFAVRAQRFRMSNGRIERPPVTLSLRLSLKVGQRGN